MASMHDLNALISSAVQEAGYVFVGMEIGQAPGGLCLRIYIDRNDAPLLIDDIATVSRQVAALLDVEDAIASRYTLEVSSPGLNRPLFTAQHYADSVGKSVRVRLKIAQDNQRQFKGTLTAASETGITLTLSETETVQLPMHAIEKANLIYSTNSNES
jgi:ribosome maturation factor RimP